MTFILRDYQETAINEIRQHIRNGEKRILYQAPTGSGKTAQTAYMIGNAARRGRTVYFVAHRQEIIKHASIAFASAGILHSVIAPSKVVKNCLSAHVANYNRSYVNLNSPIAIGSIQTLIRQLSKLPEPDLIILDECHHATAESWLKLIHYFPKAVILGLSATPTRMNGKPLGDIFNVMVAGPSVASLIEWACLSPYKAYAPASQIDVGGIKTLAGDFEKQALEEASNKPRLIGDAVTHYRRYLDGKRAVVFCVSRKHSESVAAIFNASGIVAAHLDGTFDARDRDRILGQFAKGEIKVLCNVDVISEGFDAPAVEGAILLRPTKSLALHLQQVGRCLRPHESKNHAIILDHAGNTLRHGLPDYPYEWSLTTSDGRKKKKREVHTRQCPQCYFVHYVAESCPACAFSYKSEAKPRRIEEHDGELVEVAQIRDWAANRDIAKISLKEALYHARTEEQLRDVAEARGYKQGWVYQVMRSRQGKSGNR